MPFFSATEFKSTEARFHFAVSLTREKRMRRKRKMGVEMKVNMRRLRRRSLIMKKLVRRLSWTVLGHH